MILNFQCIIAMGTYKLRIAWQSTKCREHAVEEVQSLPDYLTKGEVILHMKNNNDNNNYNFYSQVYRSLQMSDTTQLLMRNIPLCDVFLEGDETDTCTCTCM